ncbi:MAG: C10 family peptidase [Bacteroidales bacterium]|jgi:PKD repeat protein
MIKRLALILWLIPLIATAQMVPASQAVSIAWSVMDKNRGSLKTGLVQDSVMEIGNPGQPSMYVITFKPYGFVVVSANASGEPVLGFSITSRFPENPDHPLRSWLLPSYRSAVNHPAQLKLSNGAQFYTDHSVQPLVSAQWGQDDPWNSFCPADSSGKRALAGCVAVAMSQIMERWQWPPKGTGEVTYSPLQHPEYGEITAIFDTTRYRWDLTSDLLPTSHAALILFHTGVSTLMNYDPVLSSTSVDRYAASALIHNFSYNPGMVFREMEAYETSEWMRMLHQELDNLRPVLYAGSSPNGKSSHAFNIDGYRNETFFHFNWGWNGAGDGWYTLAGMAGGGADFSNQQSAIFGIQPVNMPLHDRPSALDVLAGDQYVQLFWDRPVLADFSHFIVYRDGVNIGQTAGTKFRDSGAENGKSYTYKITAWYQGENSGESVPTPDITVLPWTRMLPGYMQVFEAGPMGWQMQGSENGFSIGTASDFQIGGNSGRIAAILSEGHQAGEQVTDYLISPVFYPVDFSHPAISFDYVFKQKPGIDKLSLLWRNFNDGVWKTMAILDSTGGYSDWKNRHYYIPPEAGNTPIQIAFLYNDSYGQGFGAAIDNFTVYEVAEPAIPDFSIDQTDLCQEQTVIFTDKSTGSIQTWDWDFGEGSEPRYATTPGPHPVHYTRAGEKTVRLSLNHLDHLVVPKALSIREKPVAGFQYSRRFMEISFTDQSLNAEQLLWIFGDGTTSNEPSPIHTYYTKSLFQVQQIAYNGPCTPDTLNLSIDMRNGTGIDDLEYLNDLTVFPNPTSGKVTLLWNTLSPEPMTIKLLSISGQLFLWQNQPPQKEIGLNLFDLPDGIYILQITSGKWNRNEQIIKITH